MPPYFVDALLNERSETDDYRPFANSRDGAPARLTYGFMSEVPDSTRPWKAGNPRKSFESYDSTEKQVAARALKSFEAVADVKFTLVSENADVSFGQFAMKKYAGYANYPIYEKETGEVWGYREDGRYQKSEVWLDRGYSRDRYVTTHEIGHVLGLKHPHEGDHRLPERQDNSGNTVMSYNQEDDDSGLGLFDVIALQSIYGPARARREDSTYVFGEDKLIWDGGGDDLITARDSDARVSINLHAGSWNHEDGKSSSLLSRGQVFLGYFTEIEDADGSRFGDVLRGNALANHLGGLGGDDTIRGFEGRDRLLGGAGRDDIGGGAGRDSLFGGEGNDRLDGGADADRLRGGAGADRFIFAKASDSTLAARDVVLDFNRSEGDLIDLRGIAAKGHPLTFVGSVAFSGAAGEVRFDHRGPDGTRLVVDVDGDGASDLAVGIDGGIALRESDFLL